MEWIIPFVLIAVIVVLIVVALRAHRYPSPWHAVLFLGLVIPGLLLTAFMNALSFYENPDRPQFVVQGSVYGVIGDRVPRPSPERDTYLVDGQPIPQEVWDGDRLGDTQPEVGGLLLVGEADGRSYWLALRPPHDYQIEPGCWEFWGYGWKGPSNGVMLGGAVGDARDLRWPWEPTWVGLQLPGRLDDRVVGEDRFYDGDGFANDTIACVSEDGTVRSPVRPAEPEVSP